MMVVDTFVGPSPIEGVGIFAAEDIKAGAVIWRFDERFDRFIDKADLAGCSDAMRIYMEKYSYPHHENPDLLVIEIDNGRFMNHADEPNTDFRGIVEGFALRDIKAGEEITCNYTEFDPTFVLLPSRVAAYAGPRKRKRAPRRNGEMPLSVG